MTTETCLRALTFDALARLLREEQSCGRPVSDGHVRVLMGITTPYMTARLLRAMYEGLVISEVVADHQPPALGCLSSPRHARSAS